MQPDVMTNVKTPFCFRLKGPAEVYADAEMTQYHMKKVYRENVTVGASPAAASAGRPATGVPS